jgi:Major Facilitator Superfamily
MSAPTGLTLEREKKLLHALFFIFGFGIMAWVPRFPELKANLGLSNGAFGSILTTGSIGAFAGLLTVGHIVHKVGVRNVLIAATALLYTALGLVVHVHSATLFIILNIAISFGITATHISINTQGFHIQERSKLNVVVSSAGYWSAGALVTAILSGFLVGHIGLGAHISGLAIFAALTTLVIVFQFGSTLVPPNEHPETDYSIKDIFTTFHFDWRVSIGFACVVYLEFAIGDWGTIFTKERLEVSAGLSTLPYIIFTIFMIAGRLSIQRFTARFQVHQLARVLALVAGIGFVATITIATHLPSNMVWTSYGLFLLAFALAGIGSSILGPTFTAAANRRSPNPSAVVIGQLGVANNVITTVLKWLVAGVIGATGSIALAMMIPGCLMILAALFTPVIKEGSK